MPKKERTSSGKYSNALVVRVTEEQRRLLGQRAALSGLSTSSWARMVLLQAVRDEQETQEKTRR